MTYRGCRILFRRNFTGGCLAIFVGAVLPACATATIEDAVPTSADSGLPTGPVDTATYPNLNVVPVAAAAQLTRSERSAKEAELKAARARIAGEGGEAVSNDDELLRRLAQTHADDVLRQIEDE